MRRINKFFMHFEWRLSLATVIWSLLVPAGSFALPAWAARVTGVFSEYAPLSWVVAGFAGLLLYSVAVFIYGTGQQRSVRSRYDARFMSETGGVDPLAKVFEGKRIYLSDFVLPSNPYISGKNFVDCEIVGPANIFLEVGNGFADVPSIKIDSVALVADARFFNGYTFSNCNFRNCTFHRVTFFWSHWEAQGLSDSPFLNWIAPMPPQMHLPGTDQAKAIEDQAPRSPKESEEETPR